MDPKIIKIKLDSGEVHVWLVNVQDLANRRDEIEYVLSSDEQVRADCYVRPEVRDRSRWSAACFDISPAAIWAKTRRALSSLRKNTAGRLFRVVIFFSAFPMRATARCLRLRAAVASASTWPG